MNGLTVALLPTRPGRVTHEAVGTRETAAEERKREAADREHKAPRADYL